jgi:hypothetical protein
MLEEKLKKLESENIQLTSTVHSFSSLLKAQKQAIAEFLDANINIRSSLVLLEEHNKKLLEENASLKERCLLLEKEVA